jgi:hypothetical protein
MAMLAMASMAGIFANSVGSTIKSIFNILPKRADFFYR